MARHVNEFAKPQARVCALAHARVCLDAAEASLSPHNLTTQRSDSQGPGVRARGAGQSALRVLLISARSLRARNGTFQPGATSRQLSLPVPLRRRAEVCAWAAPPAATRFCRTVRTPTAPSLCTHLERPPTLWSGSGCAGEALELGSNSSEAVCSRAYPPNAPRLSPHLGSSVSGDRSEGAKGPVHRQL